MTFVIIKKTIMEGRMSEEVTPEESTIFTKAESKSFGFSSFTVDYVNTSEVSYLRTEEETDFKVKNFLC